MKPAFPLTLRTKKSAASCLDDAADHSLGASLTLRTGPIIDAVVILITAGIIQRVAVRAITQRTPFMADRLVQNVDRCPGDSGPLRAAEAIASRARVDPGHKQNLRCVQVSDTGDGLLIEQGHLDESATAPKPLTKRLGGHQQGVDAQSSVNERGDLRIIEQTDGTEPATIPKKQLPRTAATEPQTQSKVLGSWRIRQQNQTGHTGFDDDRLTIFQPNHHPFATAIDRLDPFVSHASIKRVDSRSK